MLNLPFYFNFKEKCDKTLKIDTFDLQKAIEDIYEVILKKAEK